MLISILKIFQPVPPSFVLLESIINNNIAMSIEKQFANKVLDGDKGKLMLEISKTFKGDKRFQLDQRF